MKITKPLSKEQAKEIMDEGGYIYVKVDVDLTDLIDNCLDGLNDLMDELILENGSLLDISYNVVGHKTTKEYIGGIVTLQVVAQVDREFWDEDEDDDI